MKEFWRVRLMLLMTPEGAVVSVTGLVVGMLLARMM